LDPSLQNLWNALFREEKTLDQVKGDVNYCFTKVLITLLEKFGTRYHVLSNIRAIPRDVEDEFVKIFMNPYEGKKKRENGEVLPLKIKEAGDVE